MLILVELLTITVKEVIVRFVYIGRIGDVGKLSFHQMTEPIRM